MTILQNIILYLLKFAGRIISNMLYTARTYFILAVCASYFSFTNSNLFSLFDSTLTFIESGTIRYWVIVFSTFILFFLFFNIFLRIILALINKPQYFMQHGGVGGYVEKDSGIVGDDMYCQRQRLKLLYSGNDEYYCQKKRHLFRRIPQWKKRQLYKELSNLSERRLKRRIIIIG